MSLSASNEPVVDSSNSKVTEDPFPSYSYEDITSGNAPLYQLDIDRIEVRVYLTYTSFKYLELFEMGRLH